MKTMFLVMCLVLSAFAVTKKGTVSKPNLIVGMPVDAGAITLKDQNFWAIAVINQLVHFRLDPLKELNTLSEERLIAYLPDILESDPVDGEKYLTVGQTTGASHLLNQKFEISQRDKVLNYYIEIVSSDDKNVVTNIESEIPLDHFATGIDSVLLMALKALCPKINGETERFFGLPVLSNNLKSLKQYGEILQQQKLKKLDDLQIARETEKIIDKDPLMLLTYYTCGPAFFRAKQYQKSAKYIKELLDLTPIHTALYLTLAQSYRYGGLYQDALNVILQCENNHIRSIPFMLEKAMAFDGMGQRGSALNTYQQILSLNPKQPQALLFMAKQRNDEANYTDAIKYTTTLLSIQPENGKAHFEKGRALYATGKFDEAFISLTNAEKYLPDDPSVQEWLGDITVRKQNYTDAVKHFQAALAKNQDNLELLIKTSQSLQLDKKSPDALTLMKSNITKFKDKPLFNKEIGKLTYSCGNNNDALQYLQAYLRSDSTDGEILLITGHVLSSKSDFSSALQYYKRALQYVTDKTSCKLSIAEIQLKLKHPADTRKIVEEILAEKQLKSAHRLMGDAYLMENDQKNALLHYKKERELHGTDPELQEKIALIHFKQGFFAPAKTEYSKLIEIAPSNANGHYYMAILLLREEQAAQAIKYLDKAESLGKGDVEIYGNLGSGFLKNAVYDKSITALKQCINLEPTNQDALVNLSEAYLKTKKDSAAAEIYLTLFNIDNQKYATRLASAGHIFNTLNLASKAAQAYALFLEKGFSDFSVNANYSMIVYKKNDYTKVISLLKKLDGTWAKDQKLLTILSDSYMKTNQYSAALQWLPALLSLDQNNKFASQQSAIAYEKTADTLNAIAMYERYIKLPPDQEHASAVFHLGVLYENKRMEPKAIAQYEANIRLYPDDLRNHKNLASLHIKSNRYDMARVVLEKAVEFPHVSPELQKMLAQTYISLNDLPKSITMYTKYLNAVSTDASGWKDLGYCYYTLSRYADAVSPLTKAADLKNDDYDVFYMLGISLMETNNFSKAVSPLGRARSIKKDTKIYEASARCYRSLKETSTLSSILREWIEFDPKRYDIKIELGSLMLDENKIPEAIAMLSEASRFIPSEPKPYILLAKAYEIQGNDKLRFEQLSTALKFAPQNWEIHYQLARYFLSIDNSEKAEQHFASCIKLNPSFGVSHFEFGLLLLDHQKITQAADEFKTALDIEPNNPMYLALDALTSALTGQQQRALDNITIALGKGPNDTRILYYAGLVYKNIGRYESAIQKFNEALSLDPSNPLCLEALGDINFEQVQFKGAAEKYFKAWEKGGYSERRAFKLGNALAYDSKYVEAKDFYETIIKRNPSFSEALFRLTFIYCELGDLKSARNNLPLFKNDGSPWMQIAQGKIYETENNLEAALVAYKIAKRVAPDNPFVHSGFGRVYLKQKLFDSSIVELSAAAAADTLNMQLLIDLGSAFEDMGDPSSAFQYYTEVEKRYPEHTSVHLKMAQIKSREGKYNEAASICEKGLKYHPSDADLYFTLGTQYQKTDKFEPAIEAFETALKKGKGQPVDALRFIGNIYYDNIINNKKAKEFYKRYVKAGGSSPEVAEAMKKLEGI